MFVKSIKWLNEEIREAIIEVSDEMFSILCFSHPCNYDIGDDIIEPLSSFDVSNIMIAEEESFKVVKGDEALDYNLCGQLRNTSGIVSIGKIELQIDYNKIPKDIKVSSFIEFYVSRVDMY